MRLEERLRAVLTNLPQGQKVLTNFDEFMEQVEADELEDRAAQTRLMSVIDYAKARGLQPQKVYYYIRSKKLATEECDCGRKCVVVADVDEFFAELERKQRKIPLENTEEDDEDQ